MTFSSFTGIWAWLVEMAPRTVSQLWLTLFLIAAASGMVGLMILRSVIIPRVRGPKKRIIRHARRWLWTWVIVVLIELFLRQERIPILSQRVWFVLFLIAMVIWAGVIVYIAKIIVPKKERELMYKQ